MGVQKKKVSKKVVNPYAKRVVNPYAKRVVNPYAKREIKVIQNNPLTQISNAMNELRDAIVEKRARVEEESREQLGQNEEVPNKFAAKVCNFLNDFRGVLDAERAKAQEENLFPNSN